MIPMYRKQCTAKTKAGKRCRHRWIYGNGRCEQHGGKPTEADMETVRDRLRAILGRRTLRRKYGRYTS